MNLTEDKTTHPLITSYSSETICIQEESYSFNVLILPSGKIIPWPVKDLDTMTIEDCKEMMQYAPEVIIIGTGAQHKLPNLTLVHYFNNYKMGIEIMNTAAACRTYNVLALEGRKMVAGLIL